MGKVVFVGNIPYDMTEEQLKSIFSEIGKIHSFRLMFDRETGKPRGYGFCEYGDEDCAGSAIRNLNGYDVGGRTLRVGPADQESGSGGGGVQQQQQQQHHYPQQQRQPQQQQRHHVQAQEQGSIKRDKPMRPLLSTPSAAQIAETLDRLDNQQLIEAITEIKSMAEKNPSQTKRLLIDNPKLAYAIFQALASMNLLDESMVREMVERSESERQQDQSQINAANASSDLANKSMDVDDEDAKATNNNNSKHNNNDDDRDAESEQLREQRELINQIMALTDEQIAALPSEQRDQVLQVKAQMSQQ